MADDKQQQAKPKGDAPADRPAPPATKPKDDRPDPVKLQAEAAKAERAKEAELRPHPTRPDLVQVEALKTCLIAETAEGVLFEGQRAYCSEETANKRAARGEVKILKPQK